MSSIFGFRDVFSGKPDRLARRSVSGYRWPKKTVFRAKESRAKSHERREAPVGAQPDAAPADSGKSVPVD